MRYEDAVKIEELATAAHNARQFYEAAKMRNVAGLSEEEHRAAAVQLQLACAEYQRTQGLLDRAHNEMYAKGRLSD